MSHLTTALHNMHLELGAKMVPFAGYDMPLQYPAGIMAEHLHTRAAAGLFDVSHMGQVRLRGDDIAAALEKLVPGDIAALGIDQTRYSVLCNEAGGILDDLMITRRADHFFLVVNAACKASDIQHLTAYLSPRIEVEPLADRALLALQGPAAVAVIERLAPEACRLSFMSGCDVRIEGVKVFITRSGYTGEDGFELSVPAHRAEAIAMLLLAQPEVKPIGLGARDSLRLEAGLCLYGHDMDEKTTPVEASLNWVIAKRRREEANFMGAAAIMAQLKNGAPRKRVGIQLEGRLPAREGAEILDMAGGALGHICSGGFGPSVNRPVAMGYVPPTHAALDTEIQIKVRDKLLPAKVCALPFSPHRYYRG